MAHKIGNTSEKILDHTQADVLVLTWLSNASGFLGPRRSGAGRGGMWAAIIPDYILSCMITMVAAPAIILYHVHDPMCSWCWGFRRSWDRLRTALPASITLVNVVGGLARDSDEAMPAEQRKTIAGYWQSVAEQTGAQFNFDFWRDCEPRRSTYPGCRAVLAAARQQAEQAMIDAIQRAYYLRAMNPSDNSTLIALAAELGLDQNRFTADLASTGIQRELERNFALRRKIGVYSFPSLVLAQGDRYFPIKVDYQSHRPGLAAIRVLLSP